MITMFQWFGVIWKQHWRGMSVILLMTAVAIAAKTAYPVIFKFIVDALTDPVDLQSARTWIYVILGVGIIRTLMGWLLPATRFLMNLTMAMTIRMRLFRRMMQKEHRFFSHFRTGDLITRMTDDIDGELKINWFSCSGIMRPIEAGMTLIFSVTVMMMMNWQLALMAVTPLPVIVWVMSLTGRMQDSAYAARQNATSATVNVLESAFSGIRIVIGYHAEHAQRNLFSRALSNRVASEERVAFLRALLESIGGLMNQVGLIIVLFAGGYYVIQEWITLGDFYAFVAYMSGLTETIWTISWFFVSTRMVSTSVDRVIELEQAPAAETGTATLNNGATPLLKLNQVTWQYAPRNGENTESFAIRDISLEVSAREMVALVGSVGSGKSTLLNLVTGTHPPQRGEVLLGNRSISDVSPAGIAQHIGFVPQEVVLFSGSVEDNVAMGRSRVNAERVQESLEIAVVADEFSPSREISQGGTGLSGGQRGRVAIARAVAAEPELLILDDSTAALDAYTEEVFWNRLRKKMPNTGILVSTHREATARRADRVLWLDQGRLIHEGTHQQLLKEYPEYRRLFASDH